ncbi:hypothetical protein [uncultured Microbacterium sp.]|uniref:hypothetical protein n=1 Tax=uncultured Microbacterium sp. TaxID=191216 RepID=UPI0028DB698B|nr:hypothetical protein [uncultured Microbacterium sp.]
MLYLAAATDADDGAFLDSATVAIIVAVIALLGVVVTQAITLVNERAKRRDEQTRAVRVEIEKLMMVFFDWTDFARSVHPPKDWAKYCEPFEIEWERVSTPLVAIAAHMAGRGKHRGIVLALIDGISIQGTAFREGESVGSEPRVGYTQMGWAAFDTVAAWLRNERVPRHARHAARLAQLMRKRLDAEFNWRELHMKADHKSGVLRAAARSTINGARRFWRNNISKPLRAAWGFLFAP